MPYLALALTIAGYLLLMLTNPARGSFRDGWGATRRYPVIWRTLAWLALANALFVFGVRFTTHLRGDPQFVWIRSGWNDPSAWLAGTPDSLWWLPPSGLNQALGDSILGGAELLAGLFNNAVTTFPIAVLIALGLFFNRRRTFTVVRGALARRFGIWAWLLMPVVLLGALASVAKAVLYFRPSWFPPEWWLQVAPGIAAVSACFEYLVGVGVQAYLILHAYAWVRGLSFDSEAMREVAIRRLGAAGKWAAIVLVAQALFLEMPLVLAFLYGWPAAPEVVTYYLQAVRIGFAGVLIIFASMQAWLTLHGETLRRAWRAHWGFIWNHLWSFVWFLVVAGLHCYAVHFLRVAVLRGVGDDTALGVAWTFLWPWIFGLTAGWLLASWVCLFKRSE